MKEYCRFSRTLPCRGAPMTEVDLRPPLSIWASQSKAMLSRRCLALWLPAGRPPPPVWISSSKSTTQSPSVAVWPARTFISRWCDGRVGSLPGHPHTPHISVPSSSPPSPTLHNREFTPVDEGELRQTGVRNNIHHLSQHLDSPVSQLILAHPDFPTMLKDVKNKSWSHQSVFFGVTVHWWKVAC